MNKFVRLLDIIAIFQISGGLKAHQNNLSNIQLSWINKLSQSSLLSIFTQII